MTNCYGCDYYDSSVDACNCDDKCYIDGIKKGQESAVEYLVKNGYIRYGFETDYLLEQIRKGE